MDAAVVGKQRRRVRCRRIGLQFDIPIRRLDEKVASGSRRRKRTVRHSGFLPRRHVALGNQRHVLSAHSGADRYRALGGLKPDVLPRHLRRRGIRNRQVARRRPYAHVAISCISCRHFGHRDVVLVVESHRLRSRSNRLEVVRLVLRVDRAILRRQRSLAIVRDERTLRQNAALALRGHVERAVGRNSAEDVDALLRDARGCDCRLGLAVRRDGDSPASLLHRRSRDGRAGVHEDRPSGLNHDVLRRDRAGRRAADHHAGKLPRLVRRSAAARRQKLRVSGLQRRRALRGSHAAAVNCHELLRSRGDIAVRRSDLAANLHGLVALQGHARLAANGSGNPHALPGAGRLDGDRAALGHYRADDVRIAGRLDVNRAGRRLDGLTGRDVDEVAGVEVNGLAGDVPLHAHLGTSSHDYIALCCRRLGDRNVVLVEERHRLRRSHHALEVVIRVLRADRAVFGRKRRRAVGSRHQDLAAVEGDIAGFGRKINRRA